MTLAQLYEKTAQERLPDKYAAQYALNFFNYISTDIAFFPVLIQNPLPGHTLYIESAKMPSFDIVSKTDLAEADNAIQNMTREMSQRYDFKGSSSKVELKDNEITLFADDDLKLRQMHELLQGHFAKRGIEAGAIDYKKEEKAAGQSVRQVALIQQGIEKELAKKIVKEIKASKLKVQVSIQGDELRVTGKKRDDLQQVISHVKQLDIELPLQYVNFRD